MSVESAPAAIGTGSLGLVEAFDVLVVGAGVSLGVSAPPERGTRDPWGVAVASPPQGGPE